MSRYSDLARESQTNYRIVNTHQKVKVDEIIARHPEKVTIIDFEDVTTNNNGITNNIPVVVIAEEPDKCFYAGTVLTKIIRAWQDVDGAETAKNLKEQGGVPVKMFRSKGKNGREYINVVVLPD